MNEQELEVNENIRSLEYDINICENSVFIIDVAIEKIAASIIRIESDIEIRKILQDNIERREKEKLLLQQQAQQLEKELLTILDEVIAIDDVNVFSETEIIKLSEIGESVEEAEIIVRDRRNWINIAKENVNLLLEKLGKFSSNWQVTSNTTFGVMSSATYQNFLERDSGITQLQNCKTNFLSVADARVSLVKSMAITDVDLSNIPLQTCNYIVRSLDILFREFPMIRGLLNKFISQEEMYAAASNLAPFSYSIYFVCEDIEKIRTAYKMDTLLGFHPQNTTYEAIIPHEFAHVLTYYISDKIGLDKKEYSKQLLESTFGKSWRREVSPIGDYAKSNELEAIAESFADVWQNRHNASFISQKLISNFVSDLEFTELGRNNNEYKR